MASRERRRGRVDMLRNSLLIFGWQHPVVHGDKPRRFCFPSRDRNLFGETCRIPWTLSCMDDGSFSWRKIWNEVLVDSLSGERQEPRRIRLSFGKAGRGWIRLQHVVG